MSSVAQSLRSWLSKTWVVLFPIDEKAEAIKQVISKVALIPPERWRGVVAADEIVTDAQFWDEAERSLGQAVFSQRFVREAPWMPSHAQLVAQSDKGALVALACTPFRYRQDSEYNVQLYVDGEEIAYFRWWVMRDREGGPCGSGISGNYDLRNLFEKVSIPFTQLLGAVRTVPERRRANRIEEERLGKAAEHDRLRKLRDGI